MLWDVQYLEGSSEKIHARGLRSSSALGLVEGLMVSESAPEDAQIHIKPTKVAHLRSPRVKKSSEH